MSSTLSLRIRKTTVIIAAGLLLMSFRVDREPAMEESLYYDVRGAFVAARGEVSHALVAETDRLVNEAIDVTVRSIVLPRTVLTVRIHEVKSAPVAFGNRKTAAVTVEAASVNDGEVIAAGTFEVMAFGFTSDAVDNALAERIAERVAREFRLHEEPGWSFVTALLPGI